MKVEQIQVVKVENGYVVTVGGRGFVASDAEEIESLVIKALPCLIEKLNKVEETKDAIRSIPTGNATAVSNATEGT